MIFCVPFEGYPQDGFFGSLVGCGTRAAAHFV